MRGEYQVGPGINFTIMREGSQLFAVAQSFGKNELLLDFEDRFTISLMGAQLTFVRNEKGEVSELTIDINNQTIRAKRRSITQSRREEMKNEKSNYCLCNCNLLATFAFLVCRRRTLAAAINRAPKNVPFTRRRADLFQGLRRVSPRGRGRAVFRYELQGRAPVG